MPLSRHDNPDRAGEPRLLGHVGAAHAGRPGPRGIANPERARRQSRETRPRAGALAWGLPQPSWAAASGRAGRRAGQCGSWPPVPSSPWCRRPIPKDRAGTRPGRWDLGVGPRHGRGPTLGAQAHSPPVRDSGRRARTRRFTHCALPLAATDPGRSNAEPRTSTPERAPRVGQCGCERHESLGSQTGWTACPDAALAYDRGGCTLTREGTPC